MNPLRLIAPALLIALVGCETTARKQPEVSRPAAALGSQISHSNPLTDLQPEFPEERALLSSPPNADALAEWAISLANRASRADSADGVRALNLRARRFAIAARQSGARQLMLDVILASTKEDGSPVEVTYSKTAEANRLVAEAEKKFARDDFDSALELYKQALVADPRCYHAALYAGDVHFARYEDLEALPWFDRAIAISPHTETAHRYRGDVLLRLGRYNDARDAYIDALIADPYNKLTRAMLPRWAAAAGSHVRAIDTRFLSGDLKPDGGKLALRYDPNHGALCLAYLLFRLDYAMNRSSDPAVYRHTLEEESAALRLTLKTAEEMRAKNPRDEQLLANREALDLLGRLDRDGLLEAHIFFDRPDEGIAQDYASYREKNAPALTRYVREIWLGEK